MGSNERRMFGSWEVPFDVQVSDDLRKALEGMTKDLLVDTVLQLSVVMFTPIENVAEAMHRAELNAAIREVNAASESFDAVSAKTFRDDVRSGVSGHLVAMVERDKAWARLERAWKKSHALSERGPMKFAREKARKAAPRH